MDNQKGRIKPHLFGRPAVLSPRSPTPLGPPILREIHVLNTVRLEILVRAEQEGESESERKRERERERVRERE